jgi:anti-anti-sigma regulatory factor
MSFRMRIDMRSGEHPEGVLQVSGRLVDDWVNEFETVCMERLRARLPLTVDLRELTYVDTLGIEAVRRLVQQGAEFTGGSAFIRRRLELLPD